MEPARRRLSVKILIAAAAAVLWVGIACWHAFKPLPAGLHVRGAEVAVDTASLTFLTDETSASFYGERGTQASIHDATLDLVANARDFLVLDYFLFNGQPGPGGELRHEGGIRPVAGELQRTLLALRAAQPQLPVLVIIDPINSYYRRSRLPPELDALARAGIDVVMTKLDPLRDSNPVYSTTWRMLMGWWLKATNRGRWPNALDGAGPTVSFGALSRIPHFKANHRKLAITGDGAGSLRGIISSGNPHDASSAHSNVALRFDGEALRPLLLSELAIARMSGWQPRAASASLVAMAARSPQVGPTPPATDADAATAGDSRASVLTEGAIRTALLEQLASTGQGDAIDIAQFYFSDRLVIAALLEAAQRGAAVRVMLDPNKDAFGFEKSGIPNREVASELMGASDGGVRVRWYRTHGEQFHAKLTAIRRGDRMWLMLGSANFTRRNLGDFNLEADVAVDTPVDGALSRSVQEWFERLWSNRPGTREYTADAELYVEPSQLRYWVYRFMEATGLSTF